jgi:UDP-glucuronate 4-epimerase
MFAATDADPETGRLEEAADAHPINHYGVYKLANEGTARIYWAEGGVSSIGVRPLTVYGAGRDQGMTSGPTVAIAAAVLGVPYEIAFGGRTVYQYAEDVGETVVVASRSSLSGAHVFNLGGNAVGIAEWVEAIEDAVPEARGLISHVPTELPFPSDIEHERIAALGDVPVTPYQEGIRATSDIFRRLAREGRLVPAEHGVPVPAPPATA